MDSLQVDRSCETGRRCDMSPSFKSRLWARRSYTTLLKTESGLSTKPWFDFTHCVMPRACVKFIISLS